MTDVKRLPSHLVALFAPRPPPKFVPATDIPLGKRKTSDISGVADLVGLLNTPDESYVPTESWLTKQQRAKLRKAEEHRKKLEEALEAWNPARDPHVRGDPFKTLFLSRMSYDVEEDDIQKEFSKFGPIERIRVVRTPQGKSRGYGFVVFERERDMKLACREAQGLNLKGREILLDVERGRTVKGWKPRRLGGGRGGRHYTKINLLRNVAGFVGRLDGGDRKGGYSGSRPYSSRGGSTRMGRDSRDSRESRDYGSSRGDWRKQERREFNDRPSPRHSRDYSGHDIRCERSREPRSDSRSEMGYRDRNYREGPPEKPYGREVSAPYDRPYPRNLKGDRKDDITSHY